MTIQNLVMQISYLFFLHTKMLLQSIFNDIYTWALNCYYLSTTFHTDTASSSFSHLCSGKAKHHKINPDKEKYRTIL